MKAYLILYDKLNTRVVRSITSKPFFVWDMVVFLVNIMILNRQIPQVIGRNY